MNNKLPFNSRACFRRRGLLVVPALGLLATQALAQSQPGGAPLLPNRVDGYGAPVPPPVPRGSAGETTLDILSSYYQQDGTHGAVEGGIGTERLTDVAPVFILNVPLDSVTRLSANVGVDFYASASTDRIDQVLSSPSSRDARMHADFGYSRENRARRRLLGLGAGVSSEYDYLSFNVAASWAQTSRDGNRQFSAAGQVFQDQVSLYYPAELGGANGGGRVGSAGTDNRRSYNLSLVLSQVLSKRLQASVGTELVYQSGLLSTPFHRVYFRETGGALGTARTELLPRARWKYPVSLRLNYYATDLVQLRGFYRFYNDDFGIRAHTLELETPVKVTPWLTLYPFYRYHTQTAATYFAPHLQHSVADAYYTSDYDLSAFQANKFGLGLRYAPLYGLTRFRTPFGGRVARLKSLDLRYAYYRRSTNLTANVVSVGLSFVLP